MEKAINKSKTVSHSEIARRFLFTSQWASQNFDQIKFIRLSHVTAKAEVSQMRTELTKIYRQALSSDQELAYSA